METEYIELENGSYFNGQLLGTSSTERPEKMRWTEVNIFWDDDSAVYVAEVLGKSDVPGEDTRENTFPCDDAEDIVLALEYDGTLSYPAHEALMDAASNNMDIARATAHL